jgi:hypothetical protein
MQEITPKPGPAMYGFEREMKPAHAIFSLEDGQKATRDAKFVYEACGKFLKQWELWPASAPQAPPCRRGQGAQYK